MLLPSSRLLLAACVALTALPAVVLAQENTPGLPPSLDRIDPNTAPVAGGTKITLIGSNFDTSEDAKVVVLVGGRECSNVVVLSSTRATAIVPRSPGAGPVDVEIRSGDAWRAVLAEGLCYDDGKLWLARKYRIKAQAQKLWLLLKQGGVIMLLLVVLSVLGVAWAIHCALVVRPGQIMPRGFLDKLSGHISRGEVQQALDACQKDGCGFGRVAIAALRKAGEPAQKIREAAQAAGSREASHLFQKISYLSNIGVISPMLGLLGTVLGMMVAFEGFNIGEPRAQYMQLAGGINKAMITTVAGLVIGIPAMACFYYFRGRLLRIATDMEQVAEEMAEAVSAAGEDLE